MKNDLKFVCGPMATISHRAFRNLIERFGGCDEYFTEMINAGSLLSGGQFEKYYIDPLPTPEKIVWQLTGHDKYMMAEAAKTLVSLPGLGLDLNMGCSAPDIYRYGAGISWMIKPIEETRAMVQTVRDVVYGGGQIGVDSCHVEKVSSHVEKVPSHVEKTPCHVEKTPCHVEKTPCHVERSRNIPRKRFSVKLRLGDDDFADEKFFAFTDMLVGEGVELLTLHPRTKKEKLIRPPRYHYAEDLKNRYGDKVKVYLNGNIKDEATFRYATEVCPSVDGIMISRAAVQKPWIFRKLKVESEKYKVAVESALNGQQRVDLEELAVSYIDDIEKYQPSEFWKTRLQRFFSYYAMNFKFSHYAQTQWLNAKNNADLKERIHDFFEKCPDERWIFLDGRQ